MRWKICCLVFISMLLVSSATVLVRAEPKNVTNDRKIGNVHVDASAVLKELGYTEENMASVPEKLKLQIARSYHVMPELHEDGDYYVTITPNSPRAEINLIGTDYVSPYHIPLAHAPNSQDIPDTKDSGGNSVDYMYDQRACLVFAIWDYPGTGAPDLPGLEAAYDSVTDSISSTNAYDYWHFMTNSECTYYYISAWITWACAAYESVDVYWLGHGTVFWWTSAFVSYDAWDDYWGVLFWNLYMPGDFTSNWEYYDYSTLRVGIGDFCYGWGFQGTFLNPGGEVSHDRAFTGPDVETNTGYSSHFLDEWSERWYYDHEGSYYAYSLALDAAENYLLQGENPFSYTDTGTSIWC